MPTTRFRFQLSLRTVTIAVLLAGLILGLNLRKHPLIENREMIELDSDDPIGTFSTYRYGWPAMAFVSYEDSPIKDKTFIHKSEVLYGGLGINLLVALTCVGLVLYIGCLLSVKSNGNSLESSDSSH